VRRPAVDASGLESKIIEQVVRIGQIRASFLGGFAFLAQVQTGEVPLPAEPAICSG
jgi:hypothetical protein